MKIGLQTWGSDGDILPFIELAKGLNLAGHETTLVYTSVDNKDYSYWQNKTKSKLIRCYKDFEEVPEHLYDLLVRSRNPLKAVARMARVTYNPAVEEMYQFSKLLCAENDLVIGHISIHTLHTAAEKMNCPRISLALCPLAIRSKNYAPNGLNFGNLLNGLFWRMGDYFIKKYLFSEPEEIRKKEGLKSLSAVSNELYISKDLTLLSTSRELFMRPRDWPNNIQLCGQINVSSTEHNLPKDLSNFLQQGDPPVYLTFGSCTQFDLARSTQLFIDAIKMTGKRAIIQANWENLSVDIDEATIYPITKISHDSIFSHCSLIVHHGGAGTTHSALRAGKPSIVVVHAFDQSFWAKRLNLIGVSGKALYRRSITATHLAKEISKTADSKIYKQNAERTGENVRKENGVKRAVELIEMRFTNIC